MRDVTIRVNIDVLIQNNLTLNQYFLLYSICYRTIDKFKDYIRGTKPLSAIEFNDIKNRGFVQEGSVGLSDMFLSEKGLALFAVSAVNAWFEEFWKAFPRMTPKERVLKQISKDKAMKKYLKYVCTKSDHDHIMSCLKREILHRTANGQREYMQNLETWLNNESWKAFEEVKTEQAKPFGSELV